MKFSRKCLLGAALAAAVIGLSASSKAAESPQQSAQTAAAGFLKLEIMTACKGEHAFFRVRNAGEAWPKTSTFAIYLNGSKGRKLVAKRRMRLKDGQRASFRIKTNKLPKGELGLWIKPGWYQREFGYDATVDCG